MDDRETQDRLFRELLDSHRALVDEVRVIREVFDQHRRRQDWFRRRWPIVLPLVVLGSFCPLVIMLAVVSLASAVFPSDAEEPSWPQQLRQHQRQLDRTDVLLDRADQLTGRMDATLIRWEKAGPK